MLRLFPSRAAAAASLLNIPSFAFSGDTAAQVSYTTLVTDPASKYSVAAAIYNQLTLKFLQTFLSDPQRPLLPAGVAVNVNYPSTDNCPTAANMSWVFTRLLPASSGTVDVKTCGRDQLPEESTTVRSGCYATISAFNATTINDVDAEKQEFVLNKVKALLTCLPK
jgi:5'-nucleotidase